MNIKIPFILIVLSLLMGISCKKELPPVAYTILKGEISNSNGGTLDIRSLKGFSKTINITDTGSFTDTLYVDNGLYSISMPKGATSVYFTKGAKVHFTADEKQFVKAINFSGNHANLNNYYAYKAAKENDFEISSHETYSLGENEFEKKVSNFQNNLEKKLVEVEGLDEDLKAKESRSINYSRLFKKEMYKRTHAQRVNLPDFKVSETFDKELTELSLNNADDYFFSSSYKRFVSNSIMFKAFDVLRKDESIPYEVAQEKFIVEIENEAIRNSELLASISMALPRAKNIKKLHDRFMDLSTNVGHKQKIKELYETLMRLEPGQPSPKFVDYENYVGGTTSLVDLKGKYVYIDVWATWCGPCKYELPFLQKVEQQYHGKNIEFVSVSVDVPKDKGKWKTMVKEKEMGGIQLFADNDFNSNFIKDYKVNGIPKFILLDPEGNILTANAPRPSDKKLADLFNQLGV